MKTLIEIANARVALNRENEERRNAFGAWCDEYRARMADLIGAESLIAAGVDLERLNHGQHVIYVSGDYRKIGGESATCIADAKADLAAGAPKLKREYFGAKNYAHWTGQRCDCSYGCGPRHGYIVFEIGLTRAAREMELTSEMLEDALYVLANIDRVLDAKKAAA